MKNKEILISNNPAGIYLIKGSSNGASKQSVKPVVIVSLLLTLSLLLILLSSNFSQTSILNNSFTT